MAPHYTSVTDRGSKVGTALTAKSTDGAALGSENDPVNIESKSSCVFAQEKYIYIVNILILVTLLSAGLVIVATLIGSLGCWHSMPINL